MKDFILRSLLLDERKNQAKAAAFAGLAGHADGAAMQFYQMFGNRQTQSRAFADASGGVANLIKLFKDRRLFIFWNTDSRVAHGNMQSFTLARSFYPYAPAFRSKFHRVIEQVIKDLFHADAVGIQRIMESILVIKLNVLGRGLMADTGHYFFNTCIEVK